MTGTELHLCKGRLLELAKETAERMLLRPNESLYFIAKEDSDCLTVYPHLRDKGVARRLPFGVHVYPTATIMLGGGKLWTPTELCAEIHAHFRMAPIGK